MTHSQIMQAATNLHRLIRKVCFGVAQRFFQHTGALGTTNSMFHPHPNASQVTIVTFLARLYLTTARLFFGCNVWTPRGS